MLGITFEFVGGPKDGRIVHGMLGEPSDAERHYLFTNHGRVGLHFKVASDYAIESLVKAKIKSANRHCFQNHFYVVTERIEHGHEVWVPAEYVAEAVESN